MVEAKSQSDSCSDNNEEVAAVRENAVPVTSNTNLNTGAELGKRLKTRRNTEKRAKTWHELIISRKSYIIALPYLIVAVLFLFYMEFISKQSDVLKKRMDRLDEQLMENSLIMNKHVWLFNELRDLLMEQRYLIKDDVKSRIAQDSMTNDQRVRARTTFERILLLGEEKQTGNDSICFTGPIGEIIIDLNKVSLVSTIQYRVSNPVFGSYAGPPEKIFIKVCESLDCTRKKAAGECTHREHAKEIKYFCPLTAPLLLAQRIQLVVTSTSQDYSCLLELKVF